jgi:hypothetical protein
LVGLLTSPYIPKTDSHFGSLWPPSSIVLTGPYPPVHCPPLSSPAHTPSSIVLGSANTLPSQPLIHAMSTQQSLHMSADEKNMRNTCGIALLQPAAGPLRHQRWPILAVPRPWSPAESTNRPKGIVRWQIELWSTSSQIDGSECWEGSGQVENGPALRYGWAALTRWLDALFR